MSVTGETYIWLMSSLFVLGVLLIPLGLSFLFIPDKLSQIGNRLNRWINTEHFFDAINRPRYQERVIYRYHHLVGISVIVCTVICIYMMLFYTDVTQIIDKLLLMTDSVFAKTVLASLYYALVCANMLAFIVGLILVIRPSVLKRMEGISNRWFETEKKLKILDTTRELPESMFPGNPRIFGTMILIGAIYIIMSTMEILI
jgi:hypothetical protein